jgi:hypothetical protein
MGRNFHLSSRQPSLSTLPVAPLSRLTAPLSSEASSASRPWVRVFEVFVDVGEDVVDFVALECFGVVGEDEGVWVAFEGCGEVSGEFVANFGGAGAHYDEDFLAAGEGLAGKGFFFFFVYGWGWVCRCRCGCDLFCDVGCCGRFLWEICWDLPVP